MPNGGRCDTLYRIQKWEMARIVIAASFITVQLSTEMAACLGRLMYESGDQDSLQ